MLPDYPEVKRAARAALLKFATHRVPQMEPLLGDIGKLRQHEGAAGELIRLDSSKARIDYPVSEFGIELTKDEMKVLELEKLFAKMELLASQLAEAQSKMLIAKVSEAAEEVGNTVSAGGELTPESVFDMLEKVEWSFDPETEEPKGMSWVMHPDTAEKILPRLKEWETNPEYIAKHAQLVNRKREEWRARENNRKLVD